MSKIPANNNYNIDITDLRQDLNIHLELCICKLCENLLKLPVTFRKCEHTFCFTCIIPLIEGKLECDTCPVCFTCVNIDDLEPSKYIDTTKLFSHRMQT